MEIFLSNVFYNYWHLQGCTNYYKYLCCSCAQLNIRTSIKIVKWLHYSGQRYPAVDCHLYCPVDLLCQEALFPLNSSLIFPITDPATFVPDRKEILTPGTVTSRMICLASTNFGGKNLHRVVFQRARQTTVSCSTPVVCLAR